MSSFRKEDLVVERTTGKKKSGGANRNCVNSCVRITHKATGVSVRVDGRDQSRNYQMALRELQRRLDDLKQKQEAQAKKVRRDAAIRSHDVVRDYDFKAQRVYDRRSGRSASLKDILYKGKLQLLRPENGSDIKIA